MITLHARFAKQGFEGEANWRLIHEMRESVSVPLIGNGDVKTPEDAKRMIDETGCEGVMVGRAAISNPWALARMRAGLTGDPVLGPPTMEERIRTAIEHAKTMVAFEAGLDEWSDVVGLLPAERAEIELRGIRALRGQLPLYIKGAPGAAQTRARLSRVSSVAELEDILEEFAAGPRERGAGDVQSVR